MGKSKQIATMLTDAPAALDTLDELAAALGDDANFATTVTNSIATKLDITDPAIDMGTNKKIRFTGNIGEIGSVPGFQATNDANDGLRSMGMRATSLRFATGSNERLRIDDGGRIGIGTTPNSNISASTFPGNISLGEQGVLLGNATSTQIGHNFYWNGSAFKYLGSGKASRIYQQSGEIVFQTTDDLGATDNNLTTMDTRLTINSVGNVGIGTTSPDTKLHVAGTQNTPSGTSKGMLLVRADGSTHGLQMGVTGSAPWGSWIQAQDNNISSSYPLTLQPGGGNVGIGVTDPTEKLTLTVGNGGGILQSTYYNGTVTSGQKMGVIGFKGYSQGNTVAGADAKIEGVADGNHSGTSAPARLDFYTKDSSIGPGSAPTRRFRIDEQGAAFIHASKNNWSRLVQQDNTNIHYRLYGASSSTTNYNLLRYRRHYWGSGSVHITLFQTYYSTTSQGEYWLSGHGRSDGSYTPNYAIQYQDIYNGPGSGRLYTNMPGGAPGNSDAEIVDVYITIPAYVYYIVKIQVSHSAFYPTTTTMPGVNSYALHA